MIMVLIVALVAMYIGIGMFSNDLNFKTQAILVGMTFSIPVIFYVLF